MAFFTRKNLRLKWCFGLLFFCVGSFFFANSTIIPWLYKIQFYYSLQHKTFPDGYLESISGRDRAFLKKHIDSALRSLQVKNEHEIAAAINDYLFQFLLRNHRSFQPIQVLKDQEAICGGNAYTMSAMLSECKIQNRIAYMLDIPYQESHCLVEATFKNGSRGLFDPTFGIYWFDSDKGAHLSMDELKKEPALASSKALKTIHAKRRSKQDSIEPFISIHRHYQPCSDSDLKELHLEEMFSAHANANVEGYEFKIFQKIRFDEGVGIVGEKSPKNIQAALSYFSSQKYLNGEIISSIPLLGKSDAGQHLNVSHIYEIKNLEKNRPYVLTFHYFKSINSVISTIIVGGKFLDTTQLTKHETVADFSPKLWQMVPGEFPGKSRTLCLNFVPEKSDINIVVDNFGDMRLHAISIQPLE